MINSKKVLLIHPSNKVLSKKDNLYTNEGLVPSLGIGYLAASCRDEGINCEILDLRLPHRGIKDVIENISREYPLFVGISAFTTEINAAAEIAKVIKEKFTSLAVVVGGPHVSLLPADTLKEFKDFDIAVVGEGEAAIAELAEALPRNDVASVAGLAYRNNGNITFTRARSVIADINSLSFPAWDLFELPFYNKLFIISASRGCPYTCYFCSPQYLGNKVRLRNPSSLVAEIEQIVTKFGAKRIQFADASLSIMPDETIDMCNGIIDKGLHKQIEWDCETRADSIDDKMLVKMKEAGCRWIALGAETGSARILKDVVKKGETKEQIIKAVSLIKKSGIKVRCFFIIGHYTETEETIKETIRFALELNPDALSFGLMVPNPGSEVRRIAESANSGIHILHNRWKDYNQFNYSCYELENIKLEELKKWQSDAYFSFYLHHPAKALGLFLDKSAYNYNIKALVKIPLMLLKRKFSKENETL